MIVLAVETATSQVGCALGDHQGVRASFHATGARRHAEMLAPAIAYCCEQAQVGLADVGAVAVDVGPGLFTGLRVGVATAKAVAQGLRVPMVGLSSLDLLAFPLRFSSRTVVSVIDARRAEVFWAVYVRCPGGVQRVSPMRVSRPEELASELAAGTGEFLLVGDGAIRYEEVLAGGRKAAVADRTLASPSADSLLELARPKVLREEFTGPSELMPVYLREADAAINWELRRPRGAEPAPARRGA